METDFPLTTHSDEINGSDTRLEELTLRDHAEDEAVIVQYPPHLHPLYNDVILIRLFGYLKLEEIKQCRSVCQKWNNLSEPFLLRLSKVTLTQKNIQTYFETFENSQLRLSAFKFPSQHSYADQPLKLAEFEEFLRKNKDTMKELHYEHQYYIPGVRRKSLHFDMSLWIRDNLKVLKGHHNFCDTFFYYSTHTLQSLKEISLMSCTLDIVTGAPIKSSKVKLTHLTFLLDGKRVSTDTVSINQFLDLSRVKELSIPYKVQLNTRENPLDFKLLEIYLCYDYDGGVLNWEKAKGTIEELKLTNCGEIPTIVGGNQIVIKKIHLFQNLCDPDHWGLCDPSPIKLSLLPPEIEKLEISVALLEGCGFYFFFETSDSVNFPALKYLEIANQNDMLFLGQLADCPSLMHLFLFKSDGIEDDEEESDDDYSDDEDDILSLDFCVSSLPKSLKTLALSGYKLGESLNEIHELDHLYLQFYDISDAKNILLKIPAKHVYLDACLKPKPKTNTLDLLSGDFKFKTLTVGPFTWTGDDSDDEYDIDNKGDRFHGSKFAKRLGLDQESEYYVFENGKGKAITKDKLKQLLKESDTDFPDVPISKRPWLL